MHRTFFAYLGSALAVIAAALVARIVDHFFLLPHVTVLLLAAVLFSAVRWGLGPSLFAALCSVAMSSYFFMPPLYSFRIDSPQDIVDLCVFVLVAIFTSNLASRVRRQAIEASQREARLRELVSFSRTLAGLLDFDGLLKAMVAHLRTVLQRPVMLLLPRDDDGFRLVPPDAGLLDEGTLKEAQRAWSGEPVHETRTQAVSAPSWTFHPIATVNGRVGLLAVADHQRQSVDLEQPGLRALLEHAAIVIERATRPTGSGASGARRNGAG